MNKRLTEDVKLITSALPQAFTGGGTTVNGRGIRLNDARKVAFRYRLGNVATTDLVYTLSVLESTDPALAGARNIGNAVATPTITLTTDAAGCVPNANIVTLTCNTPLAGEVVIINGVTLTGQAALDVDAREYDRTGNVAAQAASLTALINGVFSNLVATTDGVDTVTIQSREPGNATITVEGITDVALLIPVTVEVVGMIEVDNSAVSAGFEYVFPRALTGGVAAASTLTIDAVTGNNRYTTEQQLSASAFIPNN